MQVYTSNTFISSVKYFKRIKYALLEITYSSKEMILAYIKIVYECYVLTQ